VKKGKKGTCVHCGHPVSAGDRHARKNCPPPENLAGNRRARHSAARARFRKTEKLPERGAPVVGTGKKKEASKT